MSKNKNFDFWLLLFWNVPAFFLTRTYGSNYILSSFIFLSIPSIYLTLKNKRLFRKVSIYSIVISIVPVSVMSYLAHRDGSWFDPSFFPRILGTYPIEDFVWAFMYVYFIVSFYEYFFEKEKTLKFPSHYKKFSFTVILISILFSLFAYLYPSYTVISYFYCWGALIFIILLPWYFISKHESLIVKIVKTGAFFLIPHLLLEYVAVSNNNWSFPGVHFVGQVSSAGITIPIEELVWIIFAVPAAIAYYEWIADDER